MSDDADIDRLEKLRRLAELRGIAPPPSTPSIGDRVSSAVSDLKHIPGFLAEQGKNAVRGFANTTEMALGAHPIIGPVVKGIKSLSGGNEGSDLPINPNESDAEKLMRKTSEGVGSGLIMPGGGLFPTLSTGAMGGAGGELGRRVGEKAGMPGIGEFVGSLLAGGATGFATGPRQSVARTHIREALDGVGPQGFTDATENARLLNRSGAQTASVAETFPQNSAIMDLAREARGGNNSNALKTLTQGRDADLRQLGQTTLDRTGPPVEPNSVANRTVDAATGTLETTKNLRSTAIRNRLDGETLPPHDVADFRDALRTEGTGRRIPEERPPYFTLAEQLMDGDVPMSRTQDISFRVKALQDEAKNPLAQNSGKARISGNFSRPAFGHFDEGMRELSPNYGQAMDEFGAFTNGPMAAEREGIIGKLADKNPTIDKAQPASRLEQLLGGYDPQTIEGAGRTLSNPVFTGGATVDPSEIARALMQQRTAAGTTNPGAAIRGLEGSTKESQIAALLTAGGRNPNEVLEPLRAADMLQGLNTPAGRQQIPEMSFWQGLIRPFRTADMALTGKTTHGIQKEAAELLAQPATPESVRRLQEIAMFDPNVRRILTARSGMISGAEQLQENE